MSTFDVTAFQNSQFTDAFSTEFATVPENEYVAAISKQEIRTTPKGQVILDVTWKIDDAQLAEEIGLPNPTVRQSVFLDVNEQGGLAIGKGKNVQLGRLRDALGQNQTGQPWTFGNLLGQVARIRVKHTSELIEGSNETRTYANVSAVTKV